MKLDSLEVAHVSGMYLFTFHGPDGPKGLGACNDLKAFVEGRIAIGMGSPEMKSSLQNLKESGDAHRWDFVAMSAEPATKG